MQFESFPQAWTELSTSDLVSTWNLRVKPSSTFVVFALAHHILLRRHQAVRAPKEYIFIYVDIGPRYYGGYVFISTVL